MNIRRWKTPTEILIKSWKNKKPLCFVFKSSLGNLFCQSCITLMGNKKVSPKTFFFYSCLLQREDKVWLKSKIEKRKIGRSVDLESWKDFFRRQENAEDCSKMLLVEWSFAYCSKIRLFKVFQHIVLKYSWIENYESYSLIRYEAMSNFHLFKPNPSQLL